MNRREYRPPQPFVVTRDGVFEITGCSGFLIENLGTEVLHCGPADEEIIPVEAGEARDFEAPEGGSYQGSYSVKFSGGTGKALILKNIGRDVSVDHASGRTGNSPVRKHVENLV